MLLKQEKIGNNDYVVVRYVARSFLMFFRFNLGVSATILLYSVVVLVSHYRSEASPVLRPYDRVIERPTLSPLEKELGEPIVPADSVRRASSGGW